MAGMSQITNPLGAFGNSAAVETTTSEYKVSAAVATKTVVSIATDGTYRVATAATNGTASLAVGVTTEAATAAGNLVQVAVQGLVKGVAVDGAVAAGDVLKRSVTTAGRLATTATPATGERFAVALAASASGVVDVLVCKSL